MSMTSLQGKILHEARKPDPVKVYHPDPIDWKLYKFYLQFLLAAPVAGFVSGIFGFFGLMFLLIAGVIMAGIAFCFVLHSLGLLGDDGRGRWVRVRR
jgi:hypothetical protein